MKIAILTSFSRFDVGYSLSGIVKSQIKMLKKYGNHVELFVMSHFNDPEFEKEFPDLIINKTIPFHHLKDYQSVSDISPEDKDMSLNVYEALKDKIKEFDIVFEHDLWFQGWHQTINLGLMALAEHNLNIPFLHWVHSIPSNFKDYWDSRSYSINNFIVYPNRSESLQVAENFRTQIEKIQCIPHILDVREFFDFSQDANDFLIEHPNIIEADIIQVYPASTDKLAWKKIETVINIFGHIKKLGFRVALIFANQFATTQRMRENLDIYKAMVKKADLILDSEVIFTSDFQHPKYEYGIPKYFVRELMQLSNLFIFPTMGESFGLIVPEVSLSSGCMMVCNKSLLQQVELTGNTALYLDFGSHCINHYLDDNILGQYASIILSAMMNDRAVQTRTAIRKRYNMDTLYKRFYLPTCMELINVCRKLIPVKGVSNAD